MQGSSLSPWTTRRGWGGILQAPWCPAPSQRGAVAATAKGLACHPASMEQLVACCLVWLFIPM